MDSHELFMCVKSTKIVLFVYLPSESPLTSSYHSSASTNEDSSDISDKYEDGADNIIDMEPTLWQDGGSTYCEWFTDTIATF